MVKKKDPVAAMFAGLNAKSSKRGKSKLKFSSLTDEAKKGRWIDFCDPRTGLPCLPLEWLWGARGFQTGRILKIEAEEGIGKSSYIMTMYGAGQQTANAWCLHFEGELAKAPADFIASFGCNPDSVISPELEGDDLSIEGCFQQIDSTTHMMRSDQDGMDPDKVNPIIVGVDSISSFGAAKNMEDGEAEGTTGIGVHSRFLSEWFRDRWGYMAKRDVFLMAVTQLRAKIDTGPSFGGARPKPGATTTIAARPLNFHCSMRLEMRASSELKPKEPPYEPYGAMVNMKVTKNKLSPKGKTLKVPIIWNYGFDFTVATVELLKSLSPLVLPNGQKFTVDQRSAGSRGGVNIIMPLVSDEPMQYYSSYLPEESHKRKVNDALVAKFYSNTELLTAIREALRIRGFGFPFETNYRPSEEELEDINPEEATTDA